MLCSRLRKPAFAFLLLASSALFAQSTRRGMVIDDLNKLLHVGRPVVSPDGAWIAYTVSHVDTEEDKSISELWMVSWDGKQDIQLTYGKESAREPRWSPDGKYLAFTSSRPGKAKGDQVWVLDHRGGEARQVTDVKQELEDYRWSPDAHQLLLTLRDRDDAEDDKDEKDGKPKPPKAIVLDRFHFKQDVEGYLTEKHAHLFLFDIAGKQLKKLTTDEKYEELEAEWSPNGEQVAFISNHTVPDPDRWLNSDVFVVDAKPSSPVRQLTTYTGEDSGPLAWSPDSKLIAFREGIAPAYSMYDLPRLAIVPSAGGASTLLAEKLDRIVSPPIFSQDGKSLLTTIEDDRNQYVAEVALSGGEPRHLTSGEGAAIDIDAAAGHIALQFNNDTMPTELYAVENGSIRPLTMHNQPFVKQVDLLHAKDLSAKSKDGTEVHSLLTMPLGHQAGIKVPMLLRIHGGPVGQDAHEFEPERQLFAAHGYAVLNVNYRGSSGRGHDYSNTIHGDWGNKEVADLLASVDAAIATGQIDSDHLGIGGWSYGGILTDYTIASTSRFKGASSGAGMGSLLGLYGIDEYILQYENEIGLPWKNPDIYLKLSYPFFHADRIKTPTLFMGGDKDFNVPLEGGEQMYQALRSVGTPAELIVYPGEFHGFTRPSFIHDRYQRWFDWYDKYVKQLPSAPADPAKN